MKYIYSIGVVLLLMFSIQIVHADTLPTGCRVGDNFSAVTGQPCTVRDCAPGDLYSAQTGKPCTSSITYLPGCFSTNGYSMTTGIKCDGSVPVQIIAPTITANPVPVIVPQPPVPAPTVSETPAQSQPVVSTPTQPVQPSIDSIANGYVNQVRKKYPSAYISGFGAVNLPGFKTDFYEYNGGNKVATMTGDGTAITFTWLDGTN